MSDAEMLAGRGGEDAIQTEIPIYYYLCTL